MTEDSKVEYRFPYDVKGFSGDRYWWNDKGVWQFDHDQECHHCSDEDEEEFADVKRFLLTIKMLNEYGLVTND